MGYDPQPGRPGSGRTDSDRGIHVFPVRVYYEDTDAAGIVYYVNYLKFAERARTEMLRLLGKEQQEMLDRDGLGFAVRSCTVDYLAPARLDDALEVQTSLLEVGGASMRVRQTVVRDGRTLADMRLRLAFIDRAGRPARLPADIRDGLAPFISPADRSPADSAARAS